MFCNTCVQLIKEEAQMQFQIKHPESQILSSSINKMINSSLVLLELSLNGRHRLEYEAVEGIVNFCVNCGNKL